MLLDAAREVFTERASQNDTLLGLADTPRDRLYTAVLTSLVREGTRQVAAAGSRRQATETAGAALEYVRRLMSDGPWHPLARQADLVLTPLTTYPSRWRMAVVPIAFRSLPVPGSVLASADMVRPTHGPGSQRRFCFSVPSSAR